MRQVRHFIGSWTIVCDVAGRVTRGDGASPFVTVAAVALAPEVRDGVRGRLIRAFDGAPVKWSAAGLPGLLKVTGLVSKYSLPILIRKVHRAEAWKTFWRDGDAFSSRMASLVGERVRYFGSDAIMKTILFISAFGALTGYLMAMRRVPEVARPDHPMAVEFTVINDMDIEDAETRTLFASYVEGWPEVTGFMAELGVVPHTKVRFEREEDEPLLLLPDYLAGGFLHADSRANLTKPVARPQEVQPVIERFSRRHGRLLMVQDGEFQDPYPLDLEKDAVTRRYKSGS